jgi:hypothetical protein
MSVCWRAPREQEAAALVGQIDGLPPRGADRLAAEWAL